MSSLRIENHSDDAVHVAVAYNPCDGDLVAEGWWQVRPRQAQTFRARDAANLHLRVQSGSGDDITFGDFNSFLWWIIPQTRFTLSRGADDSAVQVLRWGGNLENTRKTAMGQAFPDGWSSQRFFRVGAGDHAVRIEPPAGRPSQDDLQTAAATYVQLVGTPGFQGLTRQMLDQGDKLFRQIQAAHLAQVERSYLNKLEAECRQVRDRIEQLRTRPTPLTAADLQNVIDLLQARSRYLDGYQPLLRELRQAGLTALGLWVDQRQNDLRTAVACWTQMYRDALKEEGERAAIQQEASGEVTRRLMDATALQAKGFERTWKEAELMRRGSPEWAARLITALGD